MTAVEAAEIVRVSESVIVVAGRIEKGDELLFIDAATQPGLVRNVVLTSAGGDAETAMLIGDQIRARALAVEVVGTCASACANYLFISGAAKRIRPTGILAFHGGVGSDLSYLPEQFRKWVATTPQIGRMENVEGLSSSTQVLLNQDQARLIARELSFLRARGVNLSLLALGGALTRGPSVTHEVACVDKVIHPIRGVVRENRTVTTTRHRDQNEGILWWMPTRETLTSLGVSNVDGPPGLRDDATMRKISSLLAGRYDAVVQR